MDSYAGQSLKTINYLSPANQHVFPKLCNAAGFTDVEIYCSKGTAELCCGLCPNTSVNGPGQFVWAIISYGIAALAYTLAPSEVWGVAVMQNLNAHAFIVAGMIRVFAGAETGGMAKYMTQFLWPQALGFIFIMAPAIMAPQWSRLGKTRADMEHKMFKHQNKLPEQASRGDLRIIERGLLKKHHSTWGWPIFAFWFLSMTTWTILYAYVTFGDIKFFQSACEGHLDYTLSPSVATCILGSIAWLLLGFDGFLLMQKPEKRMGGSDYVIEFWLPQPAKERSAFEHRRLERRITIGTTAGLFLLWLVLNAWIYIEGLNRFLLSGADYMTFGQVEQLTALFPDLLALYLGIHGYLKSRDQLRETRGQISAAATRATSRDEIHAFTDRGLPPLERAPSDSWRSLRSALDKVGHGTVDPPALRSEGSRPQHSSRSTQRHSETQSDEETQSRGRISSMEGFSSGAVSRPESLGSHSLTRRSRSNSRARTGFIRLGGLTPVGDAQQSD